MTTCTYCGAGGVTTRDHIPPKLLFARPRPKLITVASCQTCNQGASVDDEYFRTMVALREDLWEHPAIQPLLPPVIRSLERRGGEGLGGHIAKNTRPIDVVTPAGIFLGSRPGYNVDLARLDRVAARTVQGLFRHHFGWALHPRYVVSAFSLAGLGNLDPAARSRLEDLIAVGRKSPRHDIGDNVFSYTHSVVSEDPGCSLWLLLFFGRVGFVCVTVPAWVRESTQSDV